MTRNAQGVPSMTHHEGSGQARVRVKGQCIYMGKWGSAEASAKYAAFVAEWKATGGKVGPSTTGLTVDRLCIAFDVWCEEEVAAGRLSRAYWAGAIKPALRRLCRLCGHVRAAEFTPRHLADVRKAAQREEWISDLDAAAAVGMDVKAFRAVVATERAVRFKSARKVPSGTGKAWYVLPFAEFAEWAEYAGHVLPADLLLPEDQRPESDRRRRRLSARYINAKVVGIIRHVFRWAGDPERALVPARVWADLRVLSALPSEGQKQHQLTDEVIERTLAQLPPVVADMVRVQRLTGMRPGEVCAMTWGEVERNGEHLLYSPAHHKTAHHGKSRRVLLSAAVLAVLAKYRARVPAMPIFSPAESLDESRALRRAGRRSKITPSQAARDAKRASMPRAKVGAAYTTDTYARAIARACVRAGVPVWSPNALRKARAIEVTLKHGEDAARAVLGHSRIDTTRHYVSRDVVDLELQRRAMVG